MQRLCERTSSIVITPLIPRMLTECCTLCGSFSQLSEDNLFAPKQIAPTLGMKEALTIEELLKGPSGFLSLVILANKLLVIETDIL